MCEAARFLLLAVWIGVGATAVMDVWGLVQKHLLGMKPLSYGLVGRWLGHMASGRLRHEAIGAAAPVAGENVIGWVAHYLIGVGLAAVLLAIWGMDWARHPTVGAALVVGVASVAAPFLLMQPAMGAGIAASRTPQPNVARLRSLATHVVFGLGLYLAGRMASAVAPLWLGAAC